MSTNTDVESVHKDILEAKADLLWCARLSRSSASLYKDVTTLKIQWFHWLYDKDIKVLEKQFAKDFQTHCMLTSQMHEKFRASKDNSIKSTSAQTNIAMLSVSGHLYAEAGRILKEHRHRSIIKFALAVNIFALSVLLVKLIFGY